LLLGNRTIGTLDAKGETTRGGAVYLQVVDLGTREESLDCRLELSVGHVLLADEATASRIGFESAGTSAELFGKAGILGITRATISVNIDSEDSQVLGPSPKNNQNRPLRLFPPGIVHICMHV